VEVSFLLATLESAEILSQAEALAKMVIASDIAENYRDCYSKMYHDPATQQKIRKFARLKEQFEEVQRFGRYHPDYKRINKETREAKREMDLDENVARFRRAENALQDLLDQISLLIGKSVSEHIKVPTGNPFFDASCSGGCGTGGSCSCSA
jgi:cell fate (sporulation/competence/biofilm development) regulator YlbF (YheA/YmcA/DUF963 family)